MKKSTIWILTIVMALTFVGLLYMQFVYMEEMINMREQHFDEGVKRSLYSLSTTLERNETRNYLEEELLMVEPGIAGNSLLNDNSTPDFSSQPGSIYNRDKDKYKKFQETLQKQYLYQKSLLNEVVLTILSQSSSRPIIERVDTTLMKAYLNSELANNGITLGWDFAIVDRHGKVVAKSAGYDENGDINEMFTQTLFPNDSEARRYYINVFFPERNKYIFKSISFMIPSFCFTFVLLVVFLFTIVIAFRQKKLSEMKNDFINNMTHEFKTPISTISLAAQMLNDPGVRKSGTMLEHISTVINDETKRLRFQVEKVLQMSMFDRQKATLKLQEVNANQLIHNIVNTFKLKVEKYGGKIDSQLDAEIAEVKVDEMHFTNVIFNLLDNAVKYRREDTPLELMVTTRNLPSNRIEIAIADNGLGMKKDDLKKIFEKFYRVSTGNRHDVKGFGLGLAYVHKMVTELKGDIRVESELGKGSKFIITLPIINE
ncbi:MAG: HAMP domain-containing sensor histidine kinase [bacterium]|nr:HAMP domain-containing sensor histidine kinase [bacterium]MDD6869195.1 HAMP domain-containing sensor histidine kinase [bacterium]MDY5827910.1 HAMP domain-containing sensor histidine kinase [Candidatus Limisoma sp.]